MPFDTKKLQKYHINLLKDKDLNTFISYNSLYDMKVLT